MKKNAILSCAFVFISFIFLPKFLEIPGVLEPWFVSKGLIYYRDFVLFHFPLGRLVLLPFYVLTDWNLLVGPILALSLNLIALWILYSLGKNKNNLFCVASLVFYSLFVWRLATAAMFYHEMLIGVLLLVATLMVINFHKHKFKSSSLFNFGFLLSIIELSGQIATPSVLVLSAISAVLIFKNQKNVFINILYFAMGALLPLVVMMLYFLLHNALGDFIFWNFIYYTAYQGYSKPSLLQLPWRELSIFYLPLILLGISLKQKFSNDKLIIFLVGISTLPFVLFSVFHFHHLSYALPVIAYSFLYLSESKLVNRGIILQLLLLIIFILPWYRKVFISPSFRIANDVHAPDPMYTAVNWIIENTESESNILVAGDPLFYYRAQRLPGNKNMYVSPFMWEPFNSMILPQLTDPDYWIIDTNFLLRLHKDYGSDEIVAYLETKTQQDYLLQYTISNWQIWRKKIN